MARSPALRRTDSYPSDRPMPSRAKPARAARAGKVSLSPKAVHATKSKARGKRRSGSRGPRVVGRNIPPSIVAMSRALRDARVRADLSKAAAAEKIGVHFVTLYAWENENRTDQPSEENLAKAAKVYGTTADTLHRRAKAIEQGLSAERPADTASTAAGEPAAAKEPRARRPGKPSTGARKAAQRAEAAPKVSAVKAPRGTAGSVSTAVPFTGRGMNHANVTLSHQAYARVLRVLADLAEDLSLTPSALGAAQQALTAPGLLNVFAAFSPEPLNDEDILTAIDAASVAVRTFVTARGTMSGQK